MPPVSAAADPDLVAALQAIGDQDWNAAQSHASVAAKRSPGGLASALVDGLGEGPAGGVYQEPTAFDVFISNGTNPALYAATTRHLVSLHAQVQPRSLLDVGCGDGRVTAGVVGASTEHIDLVEPSETMLRHAADRLAMGPAEVATHATGAVEFLAAADEQAQWGLVQSTFAVHSLPPDDRRLVLQMLSSRTPHLVLVEFDVPGEGVLADGEAFLAFLAMRYDAGVREYREHPEAVTGFLLPVLLGLLDPTLPRHTYEQPIVDWESDLRAAGFTHTSVTPLYDYWWSPAAAIHATT